MSITTLHSLALFPRGIQQLTHVNIVLDDRGSRVQFPLGLGIFLFTTAPRMALGPTQPPMQWVPGALSLGVKWPGHECDHSPPSNAKVKNAWSYTSTPPIHLHGMVLS
jgi:hypothetical protein